MRILYLACLLVFCFGSTQVNGADDRRRLGRPSLSNTNDKLEERLTALIDNLMDLDGRSDDTGKLQDDLDELNTLRGLEAALEDKARQQRGPQVQRGFWWSCPRCGQTRFDNNPPSRFCRCPIQIAPGKTFFDEAEEEE